MYSRSVLQFPRRRPCKSSRSVPGVCQDDVFWVGWQTFRNIEIVFVWLDTSGVYRRAFADTDTSLSDEQNHSRFLSCPGRCFGSLLARARLGRDVGVELHLASRLCNPAPLCLARQTFRALVTALQLQSSPVQTVVCSPSRRCP